MDLKEEEVDGPSERRIRGTVLRLVGASLASVLAFGAPMDGSGSASAVGPMRFFPAQVPSLTTLPAGWPGPAPELKTPRESDVWTLVYDACGRHGILDQAITMYQVLWEESRLTPSVRSPSGRYIGISQFSPSTFRYNVDAMRRLGLIWGDQTWSPFDPVQAIEVMAWMWSQGYHDHWGPYRRVSRRIAAARASARLN